MRKNNILRQADVCRLATWLLGRKADHAKSNPSFAEVADTATKELGFTVTKANVRYMVEEGIVEDFRPQSNMPNRIARNADVSALLESVIELRNDLSAALDRIHRLEVAFGTERPKRGA